MADDPRLGVMTARIRLALIASGAGRAPADAAGFAPGALAAVDAADPLRALLANDGRAVEKLAQAISGCSDEDWEDVKRRNPDWRKAPGADAARAVLAALREVAGGG